MILLLKVAKSLVSNELGDFQFPLSIVIWYEILLVFDLVSKQLQRISRKVNLIGFFFWYIKKQVVLMLYMCKKTFPYKRIYILIQHQAISSLTRRLKQYQEYKSVCSFSFSNRFHSSDDKRLKCSCVKFKATLENWESWKLWYWWKWYGWGVNIYCLTIRYIGIFYTSDLFSMFKRYCTASFILLSLCIASPMSCLNI